MTGDPLRPKVKELVRGLSPQTRSGVAAAWTTLPPRGRNAGAGVPRSGPGRSF